jgi:TolB-like protein
MALSGLAAQCKESHLHVTCTSQRRYDESVGADDGQPMKVRVGDFELDLSAGQLQGPGINVFLAEQPFRILGLLLKRTGRIVTRSEIQRELWPGGTIVEFEHSINVAVQRLRAAFGESATTHKYVETVRGRGYRLTSDVERATRSHTGAAKVGSSINGPIESVVVLPFGAERSDAEMKFFSARITETIINSLTQLGQLRVTSRTTAFRYKRRSIDILSICRDLSVQGIITGRVAVRKGSVIVGAELIDARSDFQLWGARFRRKASNLCVVQAEIAREICNGIRDQLIKGARGRARPVPDGQSSNAQFEQTMDAFSASSSCHQSEFRPSTKALDKD